MSRSNPDDMTPATPSGLLRGFAIAVETLQGHVDPVPPDPIFGSLRDQSEYLQKAEDELNRQRVWARRRNWQAPERLVKFDALANNRWPEWMAVYNAVAGKLGKGGVMIALIGLRDIGKTQLCVELMKAVTAKRDGGPALFDTAAGFFRALKSTYSKAATETENMVVHRYREPSLLIVDEIGKTGATDWEVCQLFELLNLRYGDCKDTIMTSNQKRDEFTATLGPSLARRMNSTGGIITCDWS